MVTRWAAFVNSATAGSPGTGARAAAAAAAPGRGQGPSAPPSTQELARARERMLVMLEVGLSKSCVGRGEPEASLTSTCVGLRLMWVGPLRGGLCHLSLSEVRKCK